MRATRRDGFTLVEVMVVVTLMTLVAGIAVSLLRSLMAAESRARQAAPRRFAVAQLRDAIRADVRRASSLGVEGDALLVNVPDGAVTYEIRDGVCVRRVDGSSAAHVYRVGDGDRWLVERDGVVTVQLVRGEQAPGVPIHVAAALGAATRAKAGAP